MTEIPESIFKRNIFRFVTTVEKFKMLSIFCSFLSRFFLLLLLLLQHKRGSLFWAESSVTSRSYYWSERVVPRRKACHRSMVPFHVATEKSNHQPTKNTGHPANNPEPAPTYLPEAIVHLELRTLFLSIYLFIFCCCCGFCNT
jgi:hypothetical protein